MQQLLNSPADFTTNSPEELVAVQQALAALKAMPEKSYGAEVAIAFLRAWLANTNPIITETKLLPNFPNPFNPETWIPYQLAADADVVLMVYDSNGRLVRELSLGSKAAGMYTSKDRAIYWDGRNAQGEAVASGIYLFSMKAGNFTAIRRALVVK